MNSAGGRQPANRRTVRTICSENAALATVARMAGACKQAALERMAGIGKKAAQERMAGVGETDVVITLVGGNK